MNEPFLILLVLSFIDLIPLSSDIRRGGGGGGGGGGHQTGSGKPSDQETAKFSFRDLGRISRHSYNSASDFTSQLQLSLTSPWFILS